MRQRWQCAAVAVDVLRSAVAIVVDVICVDADRHFFTVGGVAVVHVIRVVSRRHLSAVGAIAAVDVTRVVSRGHLSAVGIPAQKVPKKQRGA